MEDSKNFCESSDDYKSVNSSSSSESSDPDVPDRGGTGIDWLISELGNNESPAGNERCFDVRCEPVVDILYAKVFIDSDTSVVVYGDITIEDDKGSNNYIVYDRDRHDCPQRIYSSSTKLHNFLQLSGPEEIPTLNVPRLVVDIRDDHSGSVVARGERPLYKTTQLPHSKLNQFERHSAIRFQGDAQGGRGLVRSAGCVELHYVAFTFGVYARVQMFLYKDDDDASDSHKINTDEDEKGVEVYGLICAKCNPLILSKECYENHMFNVIEDDHEWVGLGTKIVLSKDLVAVPAYSELEISVDLSGYKDAGFIAQGTACFQPTNYSGGHQDIRGDNGFYVRVQVTWQEPSLLNKPWRDEDRVGCFLTVPQQPEIYASHLLEVFSLFIGRRPNDEEVRLYGSVKIFDSRGFCDIFTCSKDEAYFLARGSNLLPLQGPKRAITPGMFFYIEIDLSDVNGHLKIKGEAYSSVGIDERQKPWYDRRLCSVVRGAGANEKSFVAINYSLFSFAVQAILTVRLVSNFKSSARFKIYGNITASYDNLSYSTAHDLVFFQSVLFTRNKANSLEVGENLELSRSLVAVPMTSSLLTDVKLSFQSSEGTQFVQEIVKFQIGESCKVIKRRFVDIHIDVEWKGLPYV